VTVGNFAWPRKKQSTGTYQLGVSLDRSSNFCVWITQQSAIQNLRKLSEL
jgi:hypothetical protein